MMARLALILTIVLAVGAVLAGIGRAARNVWRVSRAVQHLVDAVEHNTTATEALAGRFALVVDVLASHEKRITDLENK